MIPETDMNDSHPGFQGALEILRAIEENGGQAWLVGGFVRDMVMGRPFNDIDIATSLSWQDAEDACLRSGFKTRRTGVKHGTITVLSDHGEDRPLAFEVTTYRVDSPTSSDNRHPDHVSFTDSIEEDLGRRDLTINAMAWHPDRGLLDPFGGADDIDNAVIRMVGDPKERFKEDALRILRACRFASQLGFAIDEKTFSAMKANKYLLLNVSDERALSEIDLLLLGDFVHDAIMRCVDVLSICLPELMAMKGFEQRTKYHIYDVLEHTAWAVQYAKRDRCLRWAALCHDMGKPACSFFDDEGVQHFYGHAKEGERIARGLLDRACMRPSMKETICALVGNHNDVIEPTKKCVKRKLDKLGGNVDMMKALLDLKRADMLAHAPEYTGETATFDDVGRILEGILAEGEAFTVRQLKVNGHDLMGLGIEQGPELGRILSELLDKVIEGDLPNERAALLTHAKGLI